METEDDHFSAMLPVQYMLQETVHLKNKQFVIIYSSSCPDVESPGSESRSPPQYFVPIIWIC